MTASVSMTAHGNRPLLGLLTVVQLVTLLAIAISARALVWSQRPPDMKIFIEPWFAHIVHWGPIDAFAHPFSNYAPAYLYLLAIGSLAHDLLAAMDIVKILSVAGTLYLTTAVAELLRSAGVNSRGALLILILPSVAINDALLGQSDAIWAGSCILALASMIRGRTFASMLWCGVAIAFKAQAAFIAPVIIGAMVGRRAPLWQWAIPALVFLATLLPPWLMGWPGMKLLTVYLDQARLDQLAGRLPNPWILFTVFGEESPRTFFVVGYAAAAAAAGIIGALAARNCRNPKVLILLGALAGTALPFLLPKMLERYYFLGDVMTLALALSIKSPLSRSALIAVQAASILSHITYVYFFHEPWPALIGAIFATAGLCAMCVLIAPSVATLAADIRLRAGRLRSPVY